MKITESLLGTLQKLTKRQQIILLVAISLIPALVERLFFTENSELAANQAPSSIDTLIPVGTVLIPIEVENSESLDSILGNKGIVDLHRPAREPGGKNRVIARRLPILRAPLNPQQFAVLAPEEQAQHIVKQPGPFWVVVQNPKHFGTNFERPKTTKRPQRLILEGGVE